MRPEDETKDARLTVALPSSIAAWIRDRARSRNTDSSKFVFSLIVDELYTQQGIRKPSEGIPEVMEALEAAKSAIDAAFKHVGLIPAGREVKRRSA